MTEAQQDRADMRRLQGGDHSALNPLVERWQVRLRTYLLRHGVSDADACDLAQETFLRVFRHANRFDPRRTFSTWMFQIALNLLRDHARRQARRPEIDVDEALVGQTDDQPSPAHQSEDAEIAEAVRHAIWGLPESWREVIILSHYEHFPHDEIAAVVGTSTKGVETRLYRARQALREALAKWLKKNHPPQSLSP